MNPVIVGAIAGVITLVVNIVVTAIIIGIRFGKLEADVTHMKSDLSEIKGMFQLKLRE